MFVVLIQTQIWTCVQIYFQSLGMFLSHFRDANWSSTEKAFQQREDGLHSYKDFVT